MSNRHHTARGYISDAGEHTRNTLDRVKELETMDDDRLRIEAILVMERNIVVTGAVLAEVMNGHADGWAARTKAVVIQTVPPFAGMGGLLFLLSVLEVI